MHLGGQQCLYIFNFWLAIGAKLGVGVVHFYLALYLPPSLPFFHPWRNEGGKTCQKHVVSTPVPRLSCSVPNPLISRTILPMVLIRAHNIYILWMLASLESSWLWIDSTNDSRSRASGAEDVGKRFDTGEICDHVRRDLSQGQLKSWNLCHHRQVRLGSSASASCLN